MLRKTNTTLSTTGFDSTHLNILEGKSSVKKQNSEKLNRTLLRKNFDSVPVTRNLDSTRNNIVDGITSSVARTLSSCTPAQAKALQARLAPLIAKKAESKVDKMAKTIMESCTPTERKDLQVRLTCLTRENVYVTEIDGAIQSIWNPVYGLTGKGPTAGTSPAPAAGTSPRRQKIRQGHKPTLRRHEPSLIRHGKPHKPSLSSTRSSSSSSSTASSSAALSSPDSASSSSSSSSSSPASSSVTSFEDRKHTVKSKIETATSSNFPELFPTTPAEEGTNIEYVAKDVREKNEEEVSYNELKDKAITYLRDPSNRSKLCCWSIAAIVIVRSLMFFNRITQKMDL